MFVSDDGETAVVGFEGMNLVPPNSSLQLEVLRFYKRGKLIRSVRLADLYQDISQLQQTVSHRAWVNGIYVNGANQLIVELMSKQNIVFSMRSGETLGPVKGGS